MRTPDVVETVEWRALAPAVFLAALFPVWAVLRGLYLSFYIEPTDTALHAASAGHQLVGMAALAGLVLVAVAVGLRVVAPSPSTVLTAGVAATVSALLGLTGLAWVQTDRALHNYGSELRAVAAFVPPAGATYSRDVRRAAAHPEVQRSWRVPPSVDDLCTRSVERFEAWADRGSVVNALPGSTSSCFYRGRRGPHAVQLTVGDAGRDPSGTGIVIVRARRA